MANFSGTIFRCDAAYASQMETAVAMVNSAADDPTDPIITVRFESLERLDQLTARLGFVILSGTPSWEDLSRPLNDAMSYLEARPPATDDTL